MTRPDHVVAVTRSDAMTMADVLRDRVPFIAAGYDVALDDVRMSRARRTDEGWLVDEMVLATQVAVLRSGEGSGAEVAYDPVTGTHVVACGASPDDMVTVSVAMPADGTRPTAEDVTIGAWTPPAPSVSLLAADLAARAGVAVPLTPEGEAAIVHEALHGAKMSVRRAARTAGVTIEDLDDLFATHGLSKAFDL